MEKVNSFVEALEALKANFLLIDDRKSIYYFSNNKFFVLKKGSRFILDEKDFLNLYKEQIFYFYENEIFSLDEQKDIEYYSLKHK